MPDILVVNASPLIFLGNAGRIELLRATGAGRIVVPEPVFDEVTSGGHADAAAKAISEAAWPVPRSHAMTDWNILCEQLRQWTAVALAGW